MESEVFDFSSICKLLGGLALFLYGMHLASRGLRNAAGNRLKTILGLLTSNRFFGVAAGTFVTVCTQSSSATTVMLVSLADASLLSLVQTVGIIFGAGIGTTLTVQMIAFELADYALLLLALGFLVYMLSRYQRAKHIGRIMMGFGLVFYGMHVMKLGVAPLQHYEGVLRIMQSFEEHPLLGVLIATAFTAVVQSSAATIAIALTLASQSSNPDMFVPLLSLKGAIPIVLGANIGTCATALISSISTTRRGKQVAVAHLIFKVVGVAVFIFLIDPLENVATYMTTWMYQLFWESSAVNTADFAQRCIANAYTTFNVINTLFFLPFTFILAKFVERMIPIKAGEGEEPVRYLDNELLNTPAIALEKARRETVLMAGIARDMLSRSISALTGSDSRLVDDLKKNDDRVDSLYARITEYITLLSQRELNRELTKQGTRLLYIVKDIERVGDVISKELAPMAEKRMRKEADFSIEGARQLRAFHDRILHSYDKVFAAINDGDTVSVEEVLNYEARIDDVRRSLHDSHLERLRGGVPEAVATGSVFVDAIISLRTIHSHIADIVRSAAESMSTDKKQTSAEKESAELPKNAEDQKPQHGKRRSD